MLVWSCCLTLPEHLNLHLCVSVVRVARYLVFCAVFCRSLFVLYLLAIVLSVLLRFTTAGYPFSIDILYLLLKATLSVPPVQRNCLPLQIPEFTSSVVVFFVVVFFFISCCINRQITFYMHMLWLVKGMSIWFIQL